MFKKSTVGFIILSLIGALIPSANAAETDDGSSGSSDLAVSSTEYSLAGSSIFGFELPIEALTPFMYSLGLVDTLTYARWKYKGTTETEAKACFERLYPGQPYPVRAVADSDTPESVPAEGNDKKSEPDPRLSLVDEHGEIKPCSPIRLDTYRTGEQIDINSRNEVLGGLFSSSSS